MFVVASSPEIAAAADALAGIGGTVAAANAAAAPGTNGVMPPAPEPASILLAMMFQTHGALYQASQGVGSAMHALFVAAMGTSGASYAATEVANAVTMI